VSIQSWNGRSGGHALQAQPMKRRAFLRTGVLASSVLMLETCAQRRPQARVPRGAHCAQSKRSPNIVLILADDLGYGDCGCYGATKMHTPNIDRLAKEGRKFTDAHAPAAVCTPTRYSLMTGRYFWRADRQWDRKALRIPLLIGCDRPTIASVLKNAGYATGCVGKWHLGFGEECVDWNGELSPGPLEVGFDYYFGTPMSHNEPPFVLVENHRVVGLDKDDPISITPPGEGAYWGIMNGGKSARFVEQDLASMETQKALAFIEENKSNPFFLYLATNNVHVPLTPNARFTGTTKLGPYGDYVAELDWMVGEVLDKLDQLGLADDTLVVFTSDNGAVHFRDVLAAGHLANGNLLGQKTDAWEGGHRIPFIVRWPGRAAAGSVSGELICLLDLLATAAALAGAPLPAGAGPDSLNVLDAIVGDAGPRPVRDELVLIGSQGYALRKGRWLFIPKHGSCGVTTESTECHWIRLGELGFRNSDHLPDGRLKPGAPPGQLYDLTTDPQETTNVYSEHLDVVADLQGILKARLAGNKT